MNSSATRQHENFYSVWNNTIMSRGWTWAYDLHGYYEQAVPCDVCGIGDLFPGDYPEFPLEVTVEGGTKYPDVLGCGAYPLFIVSEYVIDDWEEAGIRGYEKFPLTVRKAKGKKIQDAVVPSYYHLKITGRCELDLDAMGVKLLSHCSKCGVSRREPLDTPQFLFEDGSWDGTDLFVSELYPCNVFGAQSIFDLARLKRRTNFRFEMAQEPINTGSKGVPYLPRKR